jgi:hypothetical protein
LGSGNNQKWAFQMKDCTECPNAVRGRPGTTLDSVEKALPLNFGGFSDPVPVCILCDAISIRGEEAHYLLGYLRKPADEHLAVTLLANTANGTRVIHDMSTDSKVFGRWDGSCFPQNRSVSD